MTQFNSFLSTLNSLSFSLHHCIIHVCHPLLIPVTNTIVMTLFRINTSTHNITRGKVKAAASLGCSWEPAGAKGRQPRRTCLWERGLGAPRSQAAPTEVAASLILLCFREVKDSANKGRKAPLSYFRSPGLGLIDVFLNTSFKRTHQMHIIFYLILLS